MNRTFLYSLLHAFFWMMMCVVCNYATFFLVNFGYTTSKIGLVLAIGAVGSVFLQLALGKLADRSRILHWKRLLLWDCVLTAVIFAGLMFVKNTLAAGILFGASYLAVHGLNPLINHAAFYMNSHGYSVNFGFSRGIGSLSFSVISMALGRLTVTYGGIAVALTGVILAALFFVTALFLPFHGTDTTERKERKRGTDDRSFLRKYPAFALMTVGMIFSLTAHNAVNTFMLQIMERVGGNSGTMGTAFSIAAILELPVLFGFMRIRRKFRIVDLMCCSAVFFIAKMTAVSLAKSVTGIYLAEGFQILSFALYASASVYYADERMSIEDKATGQGWMASAAAAGGAIGNFAGGVANDHFGVAGLLWTAIGATVIGAVLCVISRQLEKRTPQDPLP
ncbi:MAG: MFS transporter [Erysipelotrichales bacterium]|nr:MFS transporter [Erysipelotrichales bacterium]MBQ2478319.1 MFS transporter [Erysipelotrichales bacterium]